MSNQDDQWWYYSAHVSIFSSIFIVIYIFVHCANQIARMPNPLWRTARNNAMEVHKKPVKISYTLKLKEDSIQKEDSVSFHLKSTRPAEIKLYWGVSVSYIFELMNSSWSDFRLAITDPQSHFETHRAKGYVDCTDTCVHSIVDCPIPHSEDDGTFDDVISVTPPPSLQWSDMKNKYRYPLTIIVFNPNIRDRGDDEHRNFPVAESGNDIYGLFAIVHVKSKLFPMATSILSSYIKMDNGSTFLLKPLYLVEDDEIAGDESNETQSQNNNNRNELPSTSTSEDMNQQQSFPHTLCSVCQTYPSSRALLPCGHVCLCSDCFPKVDRCPICRGQMDHFFKIRTENYRRPENENETNVPRYRSWFEILEDFNDTLNNWLGFH